MPPVPFICTKKMMSKTSLILFWVCWLLDVLMALYGHREFIMGVFGRYAAPSPKYISMWTALFGAGLLIITGSLYLKNHGQPGVALWVAAIPMVFALPYVLWLALMVIGGKSSNWR